MRIRYTNYPQSKKLTNKSKRVATLTHPLYGIILGGFLGVVSAFVFSSSVAIPLILMAAGVVVCPIMLIAYRKKKFAQYDAQYAALVNPTQNLQPQTDNTPQNNSNPPQKSSFTKENLKMLLLGILFIAAAFFVVPTVFEGFTFRLWGIIPLNATVLSWVLGIVGAMCILVGILDKKKD